MAGASLPKGGLHRNPPLIISNEGRDYLQPKKRGREAIISIEGRD